MKFVAVPLLAVSTFAVPQSIPASTDVPNHFRWSERTARELDYKHTIGMANDLNPTDRKALLSGVVKRLKHAASTDQEMFDDVSERHLQRLASDCWTPPTRTGFEASRS